MKELCTLVKQKPFNYEGSIKEGTTIYFGDGWKVKVAGSHYSTLLEKFDGHTLAIGASRANPPKNSLGEWLMANVTKTAIASYVVPILINEGYAFNDGKYKIFIRAQ
ncbi:hypothetical protein V7138_00670 [Bacillus sp. JJ1533]|uniref:hypothetical protein n=1 Tax=Bacillus sp. JJ1533 TaxID=3122959 RepID=UPI002FFE6F3C